MPGFEWIDGEEKDAVMAVFDEGGVLFAHGFDGMRKHFHIREFEQKAQEYFQVEHCLAVASGTAAIKVALKSVGVQPGDEVITQAFNFIATVEAILDCGAVPVITNVDSSLNMDFDDLQTRSSLVTFLARPPSLIALWQCSWMFLETYGDVFSRFSKILVPLQFSAAHQVYFVINCYKML